MVAKYSLVKQHESVQHWTNANVDGACVCDQKWNKWHPRFNSLLKKKIQWVYVVEIAGTWDQTLLMALCHGFEGSVCSFVIDAILEAVNADVRDLVWEISHLSGGKDVLLSRVPLQESHKCTRLGGKKKKDKEGGQSAGFVLLCPLSGEQ